MDDMFEMKRIPFVHQVKIKFVPRPEDNTSRQQVKNEIEKMIWRGGTVQTPAWSELLDMQKMRAGMVQPPKPMS